ncbi:MAG: FAD:protein FMN transferase [Deltaproteobacteria bacterium]|nr:FAD:protein FMN transferase [Deltaproteobacteria bacterium]
MLKKSFLLFFCAITLFFLMASNELAAKNIAKDKDSEYDPHGNTCKAEGRCTYTRGETLPGNLKTEVQIVSLGAFLGDIEKVFDFAFSDVRRVAKLLDENDPQSEISFVNANAGESFVEVGPELSQILTAAKKSYLWTDGAFDITSTPEIGRFNNIKIVGNKVMLKKRGMKISLKNIVSGYIADLLIRAIYNANIDNALVEVGRASRSLGVSVTGVWRTQVDDSSSGYAKRGMTLDTSNVSVASVIAGDNAAAIDPRWASPLPQTCRSVTVISKNAAIAEALAHGIYVLGPDKGMQLITKLQTIKGVIVNNEGVFLKSPGL